MSTDGPEHLFDIDWHYSHHADRSVCPLVKGVTIQAVDTLNCIPKLVFNNYTYCKIKIRMEHVVVYWLNCLLIVNSSVYGTGLTVK